MLAIHPTDELIEATSKGANFDDVIDLDGLNVSEPAPAAHAGPFVFENLLAALSKTDEDLASVEP